jgi:type VI secretion system protein ImpL
MMVARWLRARFGSFSAALLTFGWLLLALWAAGIVTAAVQLGSWRQELSRTLLQLNADAQFRARAHSRDAVDPEWYRRKALALLSATQRMQHDASWTTFVPGSWRTFDNLEEQVQARLDREFSEIVVETMRRELYARASKLTGVPLVRGSGELQPGAECQSPVPQNIDRRLTVAAEDLPEFIAVADYVAAVQGLDDAVQSFLSLQYAGGQPDQLRKLVTYTLDQRLPGALAGAVDMFRSGDEVKLQPALMQSRLQWATRCALGKAMSALHTRLLNTNDLFALEQGFVERSTGLFEPAARPVAFDRTLERYRAVSALLEDQHALLSKGHNDWMGQGTLQLGPAYQQVLARIARTRLLGPEVVQQLQNQSGEAFAEFRRQFEQAFGTRGEPGIVWMENERRFGLSPDRAALRQGLEGLLKTSFMAEDTARAARTARETGSLAKVVQEARALAAERERAIAEIVPTFPQHAQPVVQRVVDARVSELVYQRAYRTLKAALPSEPRGPLDPAAFRQQREQVLALQAVLKETGGAALGDKLVATLDGELVRRLAGLREDWMQLPLQGARADDFGWWQGEPLSLAQTLGAEGAGAPSLSRTATRIDVLAQQAKALLALGSPSLAAEPAAARWRELHAELERYNAHAADSSLVRLERYLATLGTDLRRENCVERLAAAQPVAAHDDEVAQRHLQLHQALTKRCMDLRIAPGLPIVPAASMSQ